MATADVGIIAITRTRTHHTHTSPNTPSLPSRNRGRNTCQPIFIRPAARYLPSALELLRFGPQPPRTQPPSQAAPQPHAKNIKCTFFLYPHAAFAFLHNHTLSLSLPLPTISHATACDSVWQDSIADSNVPYHLRPARFPYRSARQDRPRSCNPRFHRSPVE